MTAENFSQMPGHGGGGVGSGSGGSCAARLSDHAAPPVPEQQLLLLLLHPLSYHIPLPVLEQQRDLEREEHQRDRAADARREPEVGVVFDGGHQHHQVEHDTPRRRELYLVMQR